MIGFGLTSFFSDLSHEVATTLLPIFLASLGAPAYAIGLIEGVSDGLANVGKLLGGWLSDRIGKGKTLALMGYGLTALTQGLFAFVGVWPQALFVRAFGWLGRGWRSPIRDALFHGTVSQKTSGRAFGFERALDSLGAVLAPAFAFFLISRISIKSIFFLTWIPGFLAMVCFAVFIKNRRETHAKVSSLVQGMNGFSKDYRRFLTAVTFFGMSDFAHTLLIYWAGILMTPIYGFAKAASLAILLYACHNLIHALAAYPMGRLADKVGKLRVLTFGYGAACLMFLLLAFAKGNFWFLLIIFLLGGFYLAIEETLERAVTGDLLAKEIKGTGYGVLATLNGIGDLFSSFVVGILLSWGSPALAFLTSFILAAGGTWMMFRLRKSVLI